MVIHDVPLRPDTTIPQLGFGVFQVDPETTQQVVETALEAGYRHLDTAFIYRNEREVGAALRASGLAREDVFVTTKLWNTAQGRDTAREAFDRSLERLGLDVLDLYLIHWPAPARGLFVETWEVFEELLASGRTRAIGVSNFRPEDLQQLIDRGLTVPAINQVELHPWLTQTELREFHAAHEIVTEAWSPLAKGELLDDPTIAGVAAAHDASPAQVVLAWHLALGNVVIPKSATPERIRANLASTGLTLSDDEVAALSALDRGHRTGPDPSALG